MKTMFGGIRSHLALTLIIGLAASGCSDGLGPSGENGSTVNLSVALSAGGVLATRSPGGPAFDILLDDGANTLVITRAAVVLRKVEIELQNDDACDDDSSHSGSERRSSLRNDDDDDGHDDDDDGEHGNDDECEQEFGPFLMEIPTDGSVSQVVSLQGVGPGVYDELEFDIHKPDDDSAEDRAFTDANPDFRRISINVEGTYNGEPFVYTSDLEQEQEIDLVPPLVIGPEDDQVNVTVTLDLDSWFRRGDGSLVNPSTANEGGPNENLVERNIKSSIKGFEDDDRDGRHDDEHDD